MTRSDAESVRCTVTFTEQQMELIDTLVRAGERGGSAAEVLAHGLGEFLRQETYHRPDGLFFQASRQDPGGGER